MQLLTRKEIEWTAKVLTDETERLKKMSEMTMTTNVERQLYLLRVEQYQDIARKLRAVIENGDRRMRIRPN